MRRVSLKRMMIELNYENIRCCHILLICTLFCNCDEDLVFIQPSNWLISILSRRTSTRTADEQVHRRRGRSRVFYSRIRFGIHCLPVCLSVHVAS